ncbi:GNAT family N-acetyltransferase [Maribacter sp. BPC-D8]|uniref:GNAT family N-acetyltransferase n=1 Tax=Maribacter sp. BPC-D8 TaxID=3053613 RepID=UPI002B48E60E|nr:GNAT family N-acetyltransferase [Maribacter sp. BPC-D8]WRI30834.1 GNAT family N-acetyltransferase [Maribacter sp. BPC-D8]
MNPKIIQITSKETLPIRHQVMWSTKPLDYVKLPNDHEGLHYGLILGNELISVISLFINDGEAQFRKFATLENYQGKGYGSLLLNEIMQISANQSLTRIWCNARQNKTDFYIKFGMTITEKTYVKSGIDFVVMEKILPKY